MKYSLKRGYSPIHLASYYGQISVIEYLVRNQSINVNAKATGVTERGRTPLHSAVKGCMKRRNSGTLNFKETFNMLIALGANPTIKDDTNGGRRTAKEYAQDKLIRALKTIEDDTYDTEYFEKKFDSCEECLAKKKEGNFDYWDEFLAKKEEIFIQCLNECSDAPCYPNF